MIDINDTFKELKNTPEFKKIIELGGKYDSSLKQEHNGTLSFTFEKYKRAVPSNHFRHEAKVPDKYLIYATGGIIRRNSSKDPGSYVKKADHPFAKISYTELLDHLAKFIIKNFVNKKNSSVVYESKLEISKTALETNNIQYRISFNSIEEGDLQYLATKLSLLLRQNPIVFADQKQLGYKNKTDRDEAYDKLQELLKKSRMQESIMKKDKTLHDYMTKGDVDNQDLVSDEFVNIEKPEFSKFFETLKDTRPAQLLLEFVSLKRIHVGHATPNSMPKLTGDVIIIRNEDECIQRMIEILGLSLKPKKVGDGLVVYDEKTKNIAVYEKEEDLVKIEEEVVKESKTVKSSNSIDSLLEALKLQNVVVGKVDSKDFPELKDEVFTVSNKSDVVDNLIDLLGVPRDGTSYKIRTGFMAYDEKNKVLFFSKNRFDLPIRLVHSSLKAKAQYK
jgi:hypothetical protein